VTTLRVDLTDGVRPLVTDGLEATGTFEVVLSNKGEPTHVHISLAGEADEYVSLPPENIYVEDEKTVDAVVGPTPGEVEGKLKMTADYGAHQADVDIKVNSEGQELEAGSVEVDESLSQPMRPEEATADDDLPRVDVLVGIVLGLSALFALLFGLIFPGLRVVGIIVASFAVLGGAFVWFMRSSSDKPKPKD